MVTNSTWEAAKQPRYSGRSASEMPQGAPDICWFEAEETLTSPPWLVPCSLRDSGAPSCSSKQKIATPADMNTALFDGSGKEERHQIIKATSVWRFGGQWGDENHKINYGRDKVCAWSLEMDSQA